MRWLLTSWGSRGDLHPFLALGRELLGRGHQVTLVGHPEWADETVAAGLRFVGANEPPRDDFLREHPEILSSSWGGLTSLRALVTLGIAPSLEPTLAALRAELPGHDALVAHHFVFAAAAAAELEKKPFITVALAPGVTPSAHNRPGPNSRSAGKGSWARALNRLIWAGGKIGTERLVDPVVNDFRRRHGLAAIRGAIFNAPADSAGLQLYSAHFAPRPPDWNEAQDPLGFCFYDPPEASLPPELEDFLAQGEAPILCTLGSAAVQVPGAFYQASAEALIASNLRGILLIGPEENRPARLPPEILAWPYASYGALMPRVLAVVHQCGIGTLSHTLRAGLPSVACPFAFDQPNNARRLVELGVAEMLGRQKHNATHLAGALKRLLASEAPARAQRLGALIRAENGAARAADALEHVTGCRS